MSKEELKAVWASVFEADKEVKAAEDTLQCVARS